MTPSALATPLRTGLLALAAAAAGCSTVGDFFAGEKVDYRSAAKAPTRSLEVPPDLTQLAKDNRYQIPGGAVSAAAVATGRPATPAAQGAPAATVAPGSIDGMRIERLADTRWLVVPLPPEQLWPRIRTFWQERGFTLAVENPEIGILETDWAENRAKLPLDPIRNIIGKVLDKLYDSGERDRYRTRIERVAGGSEVYISHRGMVEVYTDNQREYTAWQPRPADPELEAEFLSRLMVHLGARPETARATVAEAPQAPARARPLAAAGAAALEVDESFDRAWRRLGLVLDRSGFSVEDRDRAAGLYFVRYVDPKDAGKEEPGFFSRMFGRGDGPVGPVRYRIAVKGDGAKTTVTVLDANGTPDASPNARQIVDRLVAGLR